MFRSLSASGAGREQFKSNRSRRLKNALLWKAVRKTKTLMTEAKNERGPPKVLVTA